MALQHSISSILENSIEKLLSRHTTKLIVGSSDAHLSLRERYRTNQGSHFKDDRERLIYLLARLPQTTLVLQQVLRSLQEVVPEARHFCDFGAGPGNLVWALGALNWSYNSIQLVERDEPMRELGAALLDEAPHYERRKLTWHARLDEKVLRAIDVSVASYSLGEVQESLRKTIVSELWKQSRYGMVIIEPGTPQGFSVIRSLRAQLIDEGAVIQVPCTHEQACPMPPKDWCHFKLNCKRPSFLRQVKNSTLGYEEENYSYVVAVKASEMPSVSKARPYGRVVRPPLKRSGHVSLDLCASTGIERMTVSKKDGELYKESRKLSLGDVVQENISRTNSE